MMKVEDNDAPSWTIASRSKSESRKARQEAAQQLRIAQTLDRTQKGLEGYVDSHSQYEVSSLTLSRTERNAETAPLLRLPGELRNKICGYIAEEPLGIPDSPDRLYVRQSGYAKDQQGHEGNWSIHLLQICRQIRHEASSLVCASTFWLSIGRAPMEPLTQGLIFQQSLLLDSNISRSCSSSHVTLQSGSIPGLPAFPSYISERGYPEKTSGSSKVCRTSRTSKSLASPTPIHPRTVWICWRWN